MFCRQPFWKQKEEFALMQGAQPAPVRSHAAFDNNLCGRANVIWNIRYGGRTSIKTLVYCRWILIKIGQADLWKEVRISLWKDNISNPQKIKIPWIHYRLYFIIIFKRYAARNTENIVHSCCAQVAIPCVCHVTWCCLLSIFADFMMLKLLG